jgi:hypothetical protein
MEGKENILEENARDFKTMKPETNGEETGREPNVFFKEKAGGGQDLQSLAANLRAKIDDLRSIKDTLTE